MKSRLKPLIPLMFLPTLALGAPTAPPLASHPFVIATDDPAAPIAGQADLPEGATCAAAPGTTPPPIRYPAVVLVPGSGAFDRDVDFGTTGTPQDLVFKTLAQEITAKNVIAVRFDTRGTRCNRHTLAPGAKPESCVDVEARRKATPETARDDIARVFEHAKALPCVDPDRVSLFAHSEGSIHVARLVGAKRITPSALTFLGMVASSAKDIVRWQSIDRTLKRDPKLKRKDIEALYEKIRAERLATPDTQLHAGFWTYRYWKMWWTDGTQSVDQLKDYPYGIVAHFASDDDSTPGREEMALLKRAGEGFKRRPRAELHEGKGHTLGADRLMGPMADADRKQLVDDIVAQARAHPEGEIDWAKVPYMGMTFSPADPIPSKAGALKIELVIPGLPAWNAGLRPGDVILSLNGEPVGIVPKDDMAHRLSWRVRRLAPGTAAAVKILRWKTDASATRAGAPVAAPKLDGPDAAEALGKLVLEAPPGQENTLKWTRSADLLDLSIEVKTPEPVRPAARPLKRDPSDQAVEKLARRLHRRYGHEKDLDDLLKRLSDATVRADTFRLPQVDALQHDPFALGSGTKKLADRARPAKDPIESARKLLRLATEEAVWGSRALAQASPPAEALAPADAAKTAPPLTQRIQAFAALLRDSDAAWNQAFGTLLPAERDTLRKDLPALAAKFLEWNYVYQDPDRERLARNLKVVELLGRTDLRPLLKAASAWLASARPEAVRALKAELEASGLDTGKPTVLEEKTPFGLIRVAGTGDDEHRNLDGENVAVLIDLGGDDTYRNRVATSTAQLKAAVVIDLEGDDQYASSVDGAIAQGQLGIGVLADLGGRDRYLGLRATQGMGMAGVGVLVDSAGDDEYRASQLAQGAGFFGVGVLVDAQGNDRYEAGSHAQAVAVGGGAAFLQDRAGDDRYVALGLNPSGYGTPGTFEGWSQGMGVGIRHIASGGLAVLHDGGGRDRMEAGDFSQGGGYYFGQGLLDAAGPDGDVYVGNRYSQGIAAHQAVGGFLERGGDDTYLTLGEVSAGLANDRGLSWFEDFAGDDRYPGLSFCGGASANNSLAVFIDTHGRDRWVGASQPANGQVNEYWGGKSLSLVFLGAAAEAKSGPSRAPASAGMPAPAPTSPPRNEARDEHVFLLREGRGPQELARDIGFEGRLPKTLLEPARKEP